jgi:hypothetical protein
MAWYVGITILEEHTTSTFRLELKTEPAFPMKHWGSFSQLHCVITQNTTKLISAATRASNPRHWMQCSERTSHTEYTKASTQADNCYFTHQAPKCSEVLNVSQCMRTWKACPSATRVTSSNRPLARRVFSPPSNVVVCDGDSKWTVLRGRSCRPHSRTLVMFSAQDLKLWGHLTL